MALGRPRSSKRSSYTSYTSTVTTIVFIVLCVLGVWMLTSNSVTPLQTTKHTDSVVSKTSNNDLPAGNDKKDTPAYEDNPGELPDDAIKSDDTRQVDNNTDDSASSQDNSQPKVTETDTGASTKSTIDAASDPDKQPETAQETTTTESDNNAGGGNNDKDVGASTGDQENPQVKESIEQEAEKPNQNENQVTEESALTQGQGQQDQTNPDQTQIDQKPDEDQQQKASVVEDQPQESNNVASTQESSEDQQQLAQENESSNDRASNNEEPQPEQEQQQQQQQEQQQRTQDKLNEEQTATSEEDPGAQKTEQEAARDEDLQSQGPQDVIFDEDRRKRIEEQQRQQRQEDQQTTDISGASSDESAQSQQQNMPDIINKEQESQFDDGSQQQQKQGQPRLTQSSSNETDSLMTKLGTGEVQNESNSAQSFPGNESSGIPKESKESKKSWSTQAAQSENQKERRQSDSEGDVSIYGYSWQLCNVTVGPDYIPCLDNEKALRQLRSTKHFEHRERHCPEDGTTCLVPIPDGYKKPIEWPKSREKIWYHNVPHPMLADVKGHQNWVKVTGEFLTFPGGGTQFIHGALHYIDFLQTSVPNIKWGKHTRVVLDVGCGVASFGGYLFERDVLTMSFAPKDEHEAQVQFALERGIPAISAVMGSKRLPFPSRVFDLVHCARCRVPWHAEGGRLLLELNRVLRPGGFFVWSATPVYQKLQEDVLIWKEMTALTASMCWELVTIQRDKLNSIGAAIYRKPRTNECYEKRKQNTPPMCKDDDDPNAAWYVPLQACMHRLPVDESERGARWPVVWPRRLRNPPTWLNSSQMGIYGKPAPQDFSADYEHWKRVVSTSYMSGLGISWSGVRNVMDMRAVYGGFAAALKDLQMWVLNVVNIDSPDTLPIIYERGLFGIYHDWCESFSTYPRTYDLLHADHLFSKLKKRCKLTPVMAEVDRIVRPGGKIIVRDESSAIGEVEILLKSMHWEVHLTFSKDQEGILSAQKGKWRPNTYADHL